MSLVSVAQLSLHLMIRLITKAFLLQLYLLSRLTVYDSFLYCRDSKYDKIGVSSFTNTTVADAFIFDAAPVSIAVSGSKAVENQFCTHL